MTHCGVLVVKDTPGGGLPPLPCVISRCYRELFGQHSSALFDLPVLSQAPESVWQALHQPAEQCISESHAQVGPSCLT